MYASISLRSKVYGYEVDKLYDDFVKGFLFEEYENECKDLVLLGKEFLKYLVSTDLIIKDVKIVINLLSFF